MSKFHSVFSGPKFSIILASALLFTFTSCERQNRSFAGKSKDVGEEVKYDVLASVSKAPAKNAGVESVLPKGPGGGAIDGQALFIKNCSACHQATGLGLPGVFPPLAKSPYVTSDKLERMASIMIYGLAGPISVLGTTYTSVMAPLGTLPNEELAAIATYVRSSFGNTSGPVEPGVFQASRDKFGSRGPFNINELGAEE